MRWTTSGRSQATGEFETLQADAVMLALGQDADSGFLKRSRLSSSPMVRSW